MEKVFSREEIGGFGFILDDVYQTGNPYVGKELPVSIADGMGLIRDQFLNMNFHAFRNRNSEIIGVFADPNIFLNWLIRLTTFFFETRVGG